mmetsp:Transcript_21101/g.38169  ORF Transcript_21101/g.38169 Transcript_21101/m.38169 type:complete len:82 (+) Transcript_21101:60-305(+)
MKTIIGSNQHSQPVIIERLEIFMEVPMLPWSSQHSQNGETSSLRQDSPSRLFRTKKCCHSHLSMMWSEEECEQSFELSIII